MMIDPLSLKLFVTIVEEGTIAGTAEREHIAASAVSKRMSELEENFGTQLLRRTNKGVVPTDAGITLLQLARGVLHDMNNLYLQISEYSSGVRGHVRLSANISSINQFLPTELRSFTDLHPGIHVQLEGEISETIMKSVAEGTADVGIITVATYHQDLEFFPYHSDQLIVITPKDHPLAQQKSVSFPETLDYDLVGLTVGSALHNQMLRSAQDLGRTPKLRMQVNSFDALCLMVEAGLGIGIVPKGAAKPYFKGLRIRPLVLDEPWANRELKICVRSYEALPAAAKLLVDHLKNRAP
ncbi:MAG: LysR family transcriptional regulator [Desulfuromonadaceae bacterium]|nr:LysR family transcriptional regulator [Desulfuromonadaceae bacterium]MDD2847594.1 LysR family transcriptional regulator [Desulfuromonadaceae bacterium]MDD4131160.1 LysR family transcriptional regulator [Desulfuromonadaceae bacterium]